MSKFNYKFVYHFFETMTPHSLFSSLSLLSPTRRFPTIVATFSKRFISSQGIFINKKFISNGINKFFQLNENITSHSHNSKISQMGLVSIQERSFGNTNTLNQRGKYEPFVPKKRRTVAGVRKRFKVTGSGKLMRRGIGNSHLAWRKQSRRKRRMKHKKWVEVENKSYAKKIIGYLGKRNYI